ncbi:MAG: glycosyltransferase family 2 protein [Clostridia bacterium]|nr:glycosyltransferase family 2 protein [Clostridia bacterium]MBR3975382.1 glycosyltransferase family 2 protein [Clostridia bacterium]
MKTLSLIVPCYNEADVLPFFYDETSKVISTLSSEYLTELVFVDDGSKDSTLEIIKELAVRDPAVKYISFSRNFGKEAAMLAGMNYAVKSDYIGILDADLQHSPDIIPTMLDFVDKQGFDVAAARRTDRTGESKLKTTLSQSFYKIINKLSEVNISESAQDFRIMKSDVVKAIISMPENIRFSKAIFSWVGFNVKWIEHEDRERAAGQTKWSFKNLIKYALDGILGFTSTPLRFGFVTGILCGFISVIALLYGFVKNIVVADYSAVVPIILAAMFFIGAMILLCIGVIGEYLARTYTEVKGRPKYIIAQTNTRNNFYSIGE